VGVTVPSSFPDELQVFLLLPVSLVAGVAELGNKQFPLGLCLIFYWGDDEGDS
jgi:hypothetical protein